MDIQLVIVSLIVLARWGIWSGAQRKLERVSALADVAVAERAASRRRFKPSKGIYYWGDTL